MRFWIEFCPKHRGRIHRQPKRMVFEQAYHCLIGPNGSGKSTVLAAIASCSDCRRSETPDAIGHYDGERMNPHVHVHQHRGVTGTRIAIRSRYSSHGEVLRDVLRYHPIKISKRAVYLFDEPEAGQDLYWILRIKKGLLWLAQRVGMVLVASHHPVFWVQEDVLELTRGYRRKMLSKWQDILHCKKD